LKKLYLIIISILVIVSFTGVISVSYATEEVKIGAVYPLTGPIGPAGIECLRGIELAVEIVNNKFEGISLPLADTEGLPNLGGAKINLLVADHESSPEKAMSGAERLISQNGVVAMIGTRISSCAATASQSAERHQIPFIAGDVSSPTLTERGFKWFFRTCPHDRIFVEVFFKFLDELNEKGKDIKRVAILCEDSLYGADFAEITEQKAKEHGYEMVAKILIQTGTTDLSSEVQKLKASKPDALISGIYISDQLLFINTAKELDFDVDGMLASTGFVNTPTALDILKKDADFVITRDAWSLDIADKSPLIRAVNKMYSDKYGHDMLGQSSWAFQAAYALFIAINNAGSTENVAIQKALQNLNLSSDQILMPWPGIQFDEKGQNFKALPLILQVKDMAYHTIWPFELAQMEFVWPMPKWSDR